MKRIWKQGLFIVIVYTVLLILLVFVEQNTGSGIRTIGDAIWYSLVTLTTVGYGDLYPVSGVGRVVGAAFVICSLGLMATIIGMLLSLLTGNLLPNLRLWAAGKKNWYIFDAVNDGTLKLGRELAGRKNACVIYCNGEVHGENMLQVPFTPGQVVKRSRGDACIFLMGEDGYENYKAAKALTVTKAAIYCRTQMDEDLMPDNVTRFDPEDSIARMYWQKHPIDKAQHIVISGSGRLAEAILERAILTNIVDHRVVYHIYGDDGSFLRKHFCLEQVLSLQKVSEQVDSLLFEEGPLGADPELIRKADRVILCEEADNLTAYCMLHEHFPMQGELHAYGILTEDCGFGDELYTAENVMGLELTRLAREMNEIYRNSVDYPAPAWEELTTFYKKSNIASADHLWVKARLLGCPGDTQAAAAAYEQKSEAEKDALWELEHIRWMRFYALSNWTFGEKKDAKARTHPLLKSYDMLPRVEQVKDADAWILLGKVKEGQ